MVDRPTGVFEAAYDPNGLIHPSYDLFADFAKKQSYAGMKAKIASAKGNCQGGVPGIAQTWSHTEQVIGAQGIFGGPGTDVGSQPTDKPAIAPEATGPSRPASIASTTRGAKTMPSSNELEASRFAPCRPVHAHSPTAYRPGSRARPSPSVATPPIR